MMEHADEPTELGADYHVKVSLPEPKSRPLSNLRTKPTADTMKKPAVIKPVMKSRRGRPRMKRNFRPRRR